MASVEQSAELSAQMRVQSQIGRTPWRELVFVYLAARPDKALRERLRAIDVHLASDLWIPPVGNHPFGYILCDMPVNQLAGLSALPEIKRLASAERLSVAQLDHAAAAMRAPLVWADATNSSYRGTGVRIGVIDTGYDVGNPDLPVPIAAWRYDVQVVPGGNWLVCCDTNATVVDTFSGHGTYIAGCIAGNGSMSRANGGDLQGIAPSAGIHVVMAAFTNWASGPYFEDSVLVQALFDLADGDYVDLINMSVGEWDSYHDGSGALEQAVDYVVLTKGIPVFCPSGNLGGSRRHYSIEIGPRGRSPRIPYTVTVQRDVASSRRFNVVWQGGTESYMTILQFSTVSQGHENLFPYLLRAGSQSARGTKQQYCAIDISWDWTSNIVARQMTEYLVITNRSSETVRFHIYEDSYWTPTDAAPPLVPPMFTDRDPNYTLTSPGTADRAITVGASVSATNYLNVSNMYTTATASPVGALAAFSGRGPRVDQASNPSNVAPDDCMAKPDFVCPGELVASVLDRNVRDTNGVPPWYTASPAHTQLWYMSLPAGTVYRSNEIQNYYCALQVRNDFREYWELYDYTSSPAYYYKRRLRTGTSAASALACGVAATMLQRWPEMPVEDLRRYMRPTRPAPEAMPHVPGTYQPGDGFGRLDAAGIFLSAGYVGDADLQLDFTDPARNAMLVHSTNSRLQVAGTWYHPYRMERFALSNSTMDFGTAVHWTAVSNRTWGSQSVPLLSNALNVLRARWDASGTHTASCQALLYVWHQRVVGPTVVITNPLPDTVWTSGSQSASLELAGAWWGGTGMVQMVWSNLTSGVGGPASFSSHSATDGAWSVTSALLVPMRTNTLMLCGWDYDEAAGVAGLVVRHIPEPLWVWPSLLFSALIRRSVGLGEGGR